MSDVRPRRRRLVQLLFVLCLALGGLVYTEMSQSAVDTRIVAVTDRHTPASPADPTFAMPPLSIYAEVVARPLFAPSRRPPVQVEAARPADFTLVGTVISEHGRDALIAHGTPPNVQHVAEGQAIEGWTVKTVETDRVVLVRDGSMTELTAKANQPAVATSPAVTNFYPAPRPVPYVVHPDPTLENP